MILLLAGIIFIACGFLLFKFPPKQVNGVIGYRTSMSMKNKDTWNEAQRYGGISMIVLGIINIILGALFYFIKGFLIDYNFQLLFMVLGAIIMIVMDERHLRKIFNKDGSRK